MMNQNCLKRTVALIAERDITAHIGLHAINKKWK